MKPIGFLGAYSIDNTGDIILGHACRQVVRRLIPGMEQKILAPRLAGDSWKHEFGAVRGITGEITEIDDFVSSEWADDLSAVIIGGGGIVSPNPSFRPFLLGDPEKWDERKPPAAWNGVCNQGSGWYLEEHRESYERIRTCCERLRYVSVRNRSTEKFLRKIGYGGPINVIPDPAFLLDYQAGGTSKEILEASGVDTEKFLIGVSLGNSIHHPSAKTFFDTLFTALEKLLGTNRSVMEVVFFPFGYMYGDQDLQDVGHRAVRGSKIVRKSMSPFEIWEMVGAMDFYLGARLHSIIAAISQFIPFIALDGYLRSRQVTSKIRELIVDADLEPHYLCPMLDDAKSLEKFSSLLREAQEGKPFFQDLVPTWRAQLEDHYRKMLQCLRLL